MPDYPPNYDPMMNIPVWLTFKYPTGKAGKTKTKGTDYKQFGVEISGVSHTWWVYNLGLASQVEAILANCKQMNRPMELAYMQTEGEGKAHLHCLSDRSGGLQCTVPPAGVFPSHFLTFVGVNGSALPPQPGGVVSPQVAAPPPSLPKKTMGECVREAFEAWFDTLKEASARRFEVDDSVKADAEIAFLMLQQAMANGLAQTAHTLFMNRNGR